MTIIEQRRTLLATTGLALLLLLGGCGRLEVASSPDTFPVPDTAASGLRYDGKIDGAIMRAVTNLLLDEEFRNYINK